MAESLLTTPRISVALATYQGERYLRAQLGSLAQQSLPPYELVVGDDCSHDGTLPLLAEFATQAAFPVHVVRNERRLGSTATFERAIEKCTGDIIALCDQDDVWHAEKLARLTQAFATSPAPVLAFSNAQRIDAAGHILPDDLWRTISFSPREQAAFNAGQAASVLLRRYAVTGATLAFRTRDRDWLLPIPHGWIHDAWLALLLAATGPATAIDEPLIQYRQHAGQQIGARRLPFREKLRRAAASTPADFLRQAANFEAAYVRLASQSHRLLDPGILSEIREKVAHCQARGRLRHAGEARWPYVWRELAAGRYRRFARGWQSVLHDLLL